MQNCDKNGLVHVSKNGPDSETAQWSNLFIEWIEEKWKKNLEIKPQAHDPVDSMNGIDQILIS